MHRLSQGYCLPPMYHFSQGYCLSPMLKYIGGDTAASTGEILYSTQCRTYTCERYEYVIHMLDECDNYWASEIIAL